MESSRYSIFQNSDTLENVATRFGVGPEFSAQCPRAEVPDGWRAWVPEVDGPVPEALTKRAAAFAADPTIPLGSTESYPLPGVTVLLRVEPRIWSRDAQGNLIEGCFRSESGIFLPTEGVTPPEKGGGWERAIAVLTVASLAVGTAATLYSWGK
jgi:hypothetical protein